MSEPNVQEVHIIGAGLAGSEAAYFLAERGISVTIHEMRPQTMTAAHSSGDCAELVCSNSFKSTNPNTAHGMLKTEMTQMGSLVLKIAPDVAVPAGDALAVDRKLFSEKITQVLHTHPNISFFHEDVSKPRNDKITLIATGPLTSPSLTEWLVRITGSEDLYFYDAIAPIVEASSVDPLYSFSANRYDKGEEAAYLNCPMDEAQYQEFIDTLLTARCVPPKLFEQEKFYSGCQPIEAIAQTGRESLRFGPMKPVGLDDPRTGKRPHAVLQLRPENRSKTAYNLVGFQTKLTYGEQARVFRRIPALRDAEFLRFGSIHRNTYVCGPRVLRPDLSLRGQPKVYLGGQLTGVEGYLESAACGMLAAHFIYQRLRERPHEAPPADTTLGALLRHVTAANDKNYQPSGMHFGLLDPLFFPDVTGLPKDVSRAKMAEHARGSFSKWWRRQHD